MAKAIDHDSSSAMASAAGGAGTGAAIGLLTSALVMAAVGVAVATGVGAIAGATGAFSLTGAVAGAASMFTGPGALLTTIVAAIGAGIGFVGGAFPTAIGALIGGAKGASQANRESSAYAREKELIAGTREQKMTQAGTDRYLAGYNDAAVEVGQIRENIGIEKGAQMVINQLQAQAGAVAAETPAVDGGEHAAGAVSGAVSASADGKSYASALAACKCDNKADMITSQRENQAAAGRHQ
jgi:hypothetical protein